MRRLVAVMFVCLFTIPLFAQEDAWYVGQTIRDIRFEGLASVSESELEPVIEPYIDQPFTERAFLELQRRLYALDFFASLLPEAIRPQSGDGVIIQFTVEERPTVGDIEFEGNRRVRDGELLDAILLTDGDIITLAKRRADEQAILDLYLERGYPDVEVSSRVEAEAESEQTIVFEISEGQQVTVREINFSGNTFASDSALRGQMETKAQNIFNSGVFQSNVLEADRARIEEYYHERGYVDAQVVDVTRDVSRDEEEDRTFLTLTVFVEEGEQYTFGGVDFEGNTIFPDETLAEFIRQREGNVLDLPQLRDSVTLAQDQYWQSGYIFNEFSLTEERDEAARSIRFILLITERPRAHIERIVVVGNEKTSDEVVLREIPLQVGDVFDVGRIREGIQNLNNLQYFSAVTAEYPPGSAEGLMELIIRVEETQTADITFGVAFGGGEGFPVSGQLGWNDRNFLGRGQTLGVQAQISPTEQLVSFNFLERWFRGERWSLGGDITLNRSVRASTPQDILAPVFDADDPNAVPDPFQGYYVFSQDGTEYDGDTYDRGDLFPDPVTAELISEYDLITDYQLAGGDAAIPEDYLMDYVEWSISVGGNTGYRFRTTLGTLALSTSLRTSLNYVGYDPAQVRPFSSTLRENLDDWQWVNTWGINSSLDRRRGLPLSPSSGYRVSQGITLVGGFLLGDRHYIRTDTRGEVYFTLWDFPVFEGWNWKGVLAVNSSLSFIWPQFWVPERYRTSPQEPVAGTNLLATNPMFIARGWDPITGGEALWDSSVELRMPIAEQVIWLDTFLDAVGIWTER
ncbi:MAG: outer membrane protein assembly factor BamA, partial [Spirochaetales bacterium]